MEKYFEIDVMKCNFLHSTNKIHDYCFGIVIILILRVLLGFFLKWLDLPCKVYIGQMTIVQWLDLPCKVYIGQMTMVQWLDLPCKVYIGQMTMVQCWFLFIP